MILFLIINISVSYIQHKYQYTININYCIFIYYSLWLSIYIYTTLRFLKKLIKMMLIWE